jgi:hypothetical protein
LSAVKYFPLNSITKCKITKTNEMFIFQEKNQIREKRGKERNIGKETKFAQLFRIERH